MFSDHMCVCQRCNNQSKYGQGGGIGWHMTVELEVSWRKSLLKYDANGHIDSDTGAASIVKLSIPDDITLHSNREEVL